MKTDHKQIRRTVERLKKVYDFKGPLHFTDFSNLGSIINSGYIYSRKFCHNHNIEFYDVADQEVIRHTKLDVQNCVRFYYKEKNMTLYRNEGIKVEGSHPHIPIPVYLLFDEEILYLDYTVFADGNAGSQYTTYGKNYEFFNDIMDWDTIFHRGPIYLDEGPYKWEFKRKRQAELLSTQPISLEYLRKIIFRCDTDYKRACNLFGKNDLYVVDRNMFNNERNFIKDYRIEIDNSINKRSLLLTFSTNLPVVNHAKHEYKLFDMNNNQLSRVRIKYPQTNNTEFNLKIDNIPNTAIKFMFWFYGILSIEEQIQ
ncbi:DUF4433 domain-containing protein [Anoxybacillus flavithermus]|uniref:DarT ssDNA thymidine ADP-ribosyltransferase family protein n=1 Tax=Anoxybacillus flavithermus TaxID=33934 RepID=UPI0018667DD9|nr:DarT ssDNA thymidine ADP-ribosyltransferase family protein [Anoxybacillus flavithermus]MBE2934609.1 DUF4433 domain-containing protein [Anoxybacillus flavithermus]